MRNKSQSSNTFPPPLPSSQAQLYSCILYILLPNGAGGQGMGTAVSSSHIVSAAPSSSGGGLLTLCPCSSVGSLPRETVHKLLQCKSFPQDAVLQEQAAPAWVPHQVTSPASKPAPAWAPPSTGPQVLPGACRSACIAWGHCLLRVHPPPLAWGPPEAARGYLLHRGPPCLTMTHHGLLHRLQWNLCSHTWSTSSAFFFTDLAVCRAVAFTQSHSSLLLQNTFTQGFFFSS